ncbi:MAG TPA: biotin transporter BioY [Actinomycetota bacterium]|nr:biotin transporter BioY [Actinomycetota bacterium]
MSVSESALRPRRRLVLADVLPGDRVRDAVLVVAFAAFTGLAAQLSIKLPFTPVPVTGQTFAVLLGGAALGWRRGLAGMVLYLAAGLTPWVPWFAEGSGGTEILQAPSFGYLVGFVVAQIPLGWLAERGWDRTPPLVVLTMILGNLVIYAFGLPWLMANLDVGLATGLELGVTPFLAGDALKILLAAGLLPGAWIVAGRKR